MKIIGTEGLSDEEVNHELQRGAKFVVYGFTISVLVVTFRRSSNIYFLRAGQGRVIKGLPFSLLTFVLGWWGIPWGPIYSIACLWQNFQGGKDVTQELLASAHAA